MYILSVSLYVYSIHILLLKLLDYSENKVLSTTLLQNKLKMQLLRSSKIQNLDFCKSIGLTSQYLSPLIQIFLKILFSIIHRTSLCNLSTIGTFLHMHGKLSGSVKNKSESRLLTDLLKLKSLIDVGGHSLLIIHYYYKIWLYIFIYILIV